MTNVKSLESLIDPKEAAEIMKISAGHLKNMRHFGAGPDSIKLGYNCVKYDKDVVIAWVEGEKRKKIAAIMDS